MHEQLSNAAAVHFASVAASVPPTRQIVFSQHVLLLDSGNALGFTVRLNAHPPACSEPGSMLISPPTRCLQTAVTKSKKLVSPLETVGFLAIFWSSWASRLLWWCTLFCKLNPPCQMQHGYQTGYMNQKCMDSEKRDP